jgi:ankyrin repeat protein
LPKHIPCFIVQVSSSEVWSKLKGHLWTDLKGKDHPKIRVDDDQMRIEFDCSFIELNNLISRSVATEIVGLCPGGGANEPRVVARFGTPDYRAEFEAAVDESFDYFRNFEYSDDDPGDLGIDNKNAKDAANQILNDHQGMVLGNGHSDNHTKELLYESIDSGDFTKQGVGLLFVEEFYIEQQAELDAYFQLPPGSAIPDPLLKSVRKLDFNNHLEGKGGFEALLQKAQEKQIKLYGINSNEASSRLVLGDLLFGEQRNALMNMVAKEVMDRAISDNPGAKFVALCGAQHSNTHDGGIPGIAQMYDAPAVNLGYDGKLVADPEDRSKRAMPSKIEQHFIEAYVKQLEKVDGHSQREGYDLREIRQRALKLAHVLSGKGVLDLNAATDRDIAKAVKREEAKRDIQAAVDLKTKRNVRRAEAKKLIAMGNHQALQVKLTEYLADDPAFLSAETTTARTTLLHEATEADQVECVKKLIAKGAHVNAVALGETPLHKARSAQMVAALVADGADVRRIDSYGRTPLHVVAAKKMLDTAFALVNSGADVNAPDKNGATPLHAAIQADNGPTVEMLLNNGGDALKADRSGNTALHQAAAKGNEAVFDFVLARLDGSGGHLDKVNAQGETALLLALKGKHDAIADKLVKKNADVTATDRMGNTALHVAASNGSSALVDALIRKRAVVDKLDGKKRTPLHRAAESGQAAAVQSVVNGRAAVNRITPDGQTELHLAVARGDVAQIKVLVDAGCNVNKRGPNGVTPLLAALAAGRADLAKQLLVSGANANDKDDQDNTALHLALTGGAVQAVPELLAKGANVKARNRAGISVLEQAAQKGGVEHVLIEEKAAQRLDATSALFIKKFVEAAQIEYKERYPEPRSRDAADDIDLREAAALAASRIAALHASREWTDDATGIANLAKAESKRAHAHSLYDRTASRKGNIKKAQELAGRTKVELLAANVEKMRVLLDADPAIVYSDPTLLHHVCKWGNDEMVTLLLERGANVSYKDEKGRTPLHWAVEQRMDKDSDLLELQQARENRTESITNALLASVPSKIAKQQLVNVQDAEGTTALHVAAWSDHPGAIKKLVDEGANLEITDKRGWRPLEVAMGSTKDRSEAMLLECGAQPSRTLGDGAAPARSTVDVLCEATFCDNPEHASNVREQLENLYANELLRPIMDLCALDALRPRVSPKTDAVNANVGGGRFFVADSEQVGKLYNALAIDKSPAGSYDEKVNILLAAFKDGERDFAGTLIHELTHLATRIIHGSDVKPCDDSNQDDYIKAIESDVRGASLLVDGFEEAMICRILCGRLTGPSYTNIGDPSFLTEFIVGVPQIMANYGPEAAERYAPELFKFFGTFKDQCEQFKAQPRFNNVRGQLDNTQLIASLKGRPLPWLHDNWLEGHSKPDIDKLMQRIEANYVANHGTVVPSKNKNGELSTILYDTSIMKLEATHPDYAEFQKKMKAIRKALDETYSPDTVDGLAADDVKELVMDAVELASTTRKVDELNSAMAKKTGQWLHKAKRHYLEDKFGNKGSKLTSTELAELVVLKTEDEAWKQLKGASGALEPDVKSKKHGQLTEVLREKIDAMEEEKRDKILTSPAQFVADRVEAVVTAKKVFKKKSGWLHDPDQLSINKRAWVKQCAKLSK